MFEWGGVRLKSDRGRTISSTIEKCLWGMSAGRCEFQGCNKYLGEHQITKQTGNFGEKAHIEAVNKGGARYKDLMTDNELNSSDNIMLLCPTCHKLVDEHPNEYPVKKLQEMKMKHEWRIYQLTSVDDIQSSLMINYFANIKDFSPNYDDKLFCRAVVKNGKIPTQSISISLGMENIPMSDGTEKYYKIQEEVLNCAKERIIKPSIRNGENISLFALAPMPLLIKLGTLFSDITNVSVYQCHRTGEKWAWKDSGEKIKYHIITPESIGKKEVVLNISLSADIEQSRIEKCLGTSSVYKITIIETSRTFVETEQIADEFVQAFRKCMELIKCDNPEIRLINIFPAMPNSLAVRLGMDYMPKTDPKLRIFDQIDSEIGFIQTLEIGE